MSTGTADLLDDPARLLGTDRAVVRAHIEGMTSAPHVGREVFQQAEAIFGGAEVPRAEFAAWLQFAAKVLGHEEYADRIAAAEPGMPWRTVWAWWRPVGKYVAHPNLSYGDPLGLQVHDGRELLRVKAIWEDTWIDLETGVHVPGPPKEATVSLRARYGSKDAPSLDAWDLTARESWRYADPLVGEDGRTRYLVEDTHGLALLETDPAVLRDWPRGDIDYEACWEGTPGEVPFFPDPDGPLTAERLDEAFAPKKVVRIPEHELPVALEHPASRAHLRDIGLPSWWACAWTTFEPSLTSGTTPLDDDALVRVALPDGLEATDLLILGSSEHGDLYLHRCEGSVHIVDIVGGNWDLIQLSPDLDHFTRVLEGVRRYMDACWHPYPDEDGIADFLEEMDGLAPGTIDSNGPSGQMWLYFIVGITGLNEDGY
ncbi:SUKH-4 family immunity protein [Streptomyces chattanoogensis]|uniref:SUKH-4 family immunity protein n=1 Tax=Streptomyces chattanoogensis TaxID=66876 RepID=UPI00368539E7